MSTKILPFSFRPELDRSTIQNCVRHGTKLSACLGGILAISELVNFNFSSAITYSCCAAVSWVGGRTVAYFCTPSTKDLFHSKYDLQHGLKISDDVNVSVFCQNPDKIYRPIGLGKADVVITPLRRVKHMEFIVSKALIKKFLSCVQRCKEDEEVSYILSPLYENDQTKKGCNTQLQNETIDLEPSEFITVVVFTPKKCYNAVTHAISLHRCEKTRQHSPPTSSETGVARWESLGLLKIPSSYEDCEKENEIKITTEFHKFDLWKALQKVANAHTYHEVGYDLYPVYVPYTAHTKVSRLSSVSEKISNYIKFISSGFEDLQISHKLKLVVFASSDAADSVRKIIGENTGGIIGNYGHCTFSIGETERKSKKSTIVRIESVIEKTLYKKIICIFDSQLKGKVSYKLQPIFERIDTKNLRYSFLHSHFHR